MKKSRFNYTVPWQEDKALLFNTGNHALVELDGATLAKYYNDTLDAETSKEMSELGFLVEDNIDELKELQLDRDKHCANHPYINLTVMVTERCNFRCPYCYQTHNPKDLSPEKTEILCSFLEKVYKEQTHTVNISWFGGEPLLNLQPIFKVERLLKDYNFEGASRITTNGFLLTEELLERFQRETRISSLQITLDGTAQQHNATRRHVSGQPTYETICRNISNAVSKGFFVIIRLNLNKENQSMDSFFDELKRLNLDKSKYAVHITNANQFDGSEHIQNFYFDTAEEYSRAYSKAQDSFIKAGYSFPRNLTKYAGCEFESDNVYLVGCDLSIYFCSSCEMSVFFRQGYINEDGELCLNENYKKRQELSAFHDEECKNCIVLPMCMGGCTYCRIKDKKFCIPEKYFLDKYIIKLYHEMEGKLQ